MKRKCRFLIHLCVYLSFFAPYFGVGQGGFEFPPDTQRDRMRFKLVNNLVVIPVQVNDIALNFILDTGVQHTLLFGTTQDSIEIKNVTPIRIRGLGNGGAVEALKSENNKIQIGKAVDTNHTMYVVFDSELNFSPRMGLPVHGIIGYEFFKNYVVTLRYGAKKMLFETLASYNKRATCKKCELFDLQFYKKKPYVSFSVREGLDADSVNLLIDSGSSDALWLFDRAYLKQKHQGQYFKDFLGLGVSGTIFGTRTKLNEIAMGRYTLNNVNTAIPDTSALKNIAIWSARDGSIGGDVLRRFTATISYPSKMLALKKNSHFHDAFYYNMSGIIVEHDGFDLVESDKRVLLNPLSFNRADPNKFAFEVIGANIFSLKLAPKIVVAELRDDSPAAKAGVLEGDTLKRINGKPAHHYELFEITALFSSKPGRTISLEIERNGVVFRKHFTLKAVL